MKFIPPFVLVIIFLQAGCNHQTEKKAEIQQKQPGPDKVKAKTIDNPPQAAILGSDTSTVVKFNEFTLLIPRLILYDNAPVQETLQADSLYLELEIAETVQGNVLTIGTDLLTDIKMEQRYETSISITNEGPNCDLTDWKHYNSPWQELEKLGVNQFIAKTYSDTESSRFPETSITEFLEAVKKECGEEYYELVKNNKQLAEGYSWIGISRVYLRITATRKADGKAVKKILVFTEAMGC